MLNISLYTIYQGNGWSNDSIQIVHTAIVLPQIIVPHFCYFEKERIKAKYFRENIL